MAKQQTGSLGMGFMRSEGLRGGGLRAFGPSGGASLSFYFTMHWAWRDLGSRSHGSGCRTKMSLNPNMPNRMLEPQNLWYRCDLCSARFYFLGFARMGLRYVPASKIFQGLRLAKGLLSGSIWLKAIKAIKAIKAFII